MILEPIHTRYKKLFIMTMHQFEVSAGKERLKRKKCSLGSKQSNNMKNFKKPMTLVSEFLAVSETLMIFNFQ